MRYRAVLWQAALLLLELGSVLSYKISGQRRYHHLSPTEINCYDLPMKTTAITPIRIMSEGFRLPRNVKAVAMTMEPAAAPPTDSSLNTHEIQKRFDHLFGEGEDIVKEHAKLVQDINSLRQVVFVAPIVDDNRDYEDSIYHEIIETSTTTTPRPRASTMATLMVTTSLPNNRIKSTGIPLLLVGGASQRQSVRAAPVTVKIPRPTISLVGSSMSPLGRHPYPFVGQATSLRPFKICMPPTPMMMTTTRRPSLWSKLLSFLPRLTG